MGDPDGGIPADDVALALGVDEADLAREHEGHDGRDELARLRRGIPDA